MQDLDGVPVAMTLIVVLQAIAGCRQVAQGCLMALQGASDIMVVIEEVDGAKTTGTIIAEHKIEEVMVVHLHQDLVSLCQIEAEIEILSNSKIVGRKPDNNRDSRQNNDRRNDRSDNNRGGNGRPAGNNNNNKNSRGNSTAGNGKFDQRRDGGRNYGGNSGSWNNYGGGNSKC